MTGHTVTLAFPANTYLNCYLYLADGTTVLKTTGQTVENVVAFQIGTYLSDSGDNYLKRFSVAYSGKTFTSQDNLNVMYPNGLTPPYLVTESCTLNMQGWHEGGGGDCLLAGTMIDLADGKQKPIEEITYEDELLVWNFDEGKLDSAKPAWIRRAKRRDYYFKNVLESGKILLTSGQSSTGWGHRMYDMNERKFIYTTKSVSDMIYTLDGPEMHMSCERINGECEYFNVITEKHFNMFANRILTSCSLNNLHDISDGMKFVRQDEPSYSDEQLREYGITNYVTSMRLNEQTRISLPDLAEYVKKLEQKDIANC